MRTHTIRWSGDRKTRIITFDKEYMSLLKDSYRESVSLIISSLCRTLENLTGKTHIIDYNCQKELEEVFPPPYYLPECTESLYLIYKWFQSGYLQESPNIESSLKVLNIFYCLWYNNLSNIKE